MYPQISQMTQITKPHAEGRALNRRNLRNLRTKKGVL